MPNPKTPAERVVHDIRRAIRDLRSTEDKIRIVSEGLRREENVAEQVLDLRRLERSMTGLDVTAKEIFCRRAARGHPPDRGGAPAGPPHPATAGHPPGDLLPLT
jgi:hypothetical protein